MKPVGLHCIACGKRMLRTLDSRPIHEAQRRTRICASCGEKMTTIEKIVGRPRRRKDHQ
ncbi:NrdR family transcriptional regulator [Aquamicrobium terrae]|uniref:NrdR family transcriptional regulator n=1 Tax=Aquamicrobium terrae TaxID=1324945 RepID=UPI003F494AE4